MDVLVRLFDWIVWSIQKRKLHHVGCNCRVGRIIKIINPSSIDIGDRLIAGRNIKLQSWKIFNDKESPYDAVISIGDDVAIMDNCQISCARSVTIENGVLLGENVFITDNYHGNSKRGDMNTPPHRRNLYIKGEVIVRENAWIGRNVCIMPGVTVGRGTVIGANAVVTKSIPDYCVAAGIPAKVVRNEGE